MKAKTIFTVEMGVPKKELRADERILATLEYSEFMNELTEGLGLTTDVEQRLNEAVQLAKQSGDNVLLGRASIQVVKHYLNANKMYTAGMKAVEGKLFGPAEKCALELMNKEEYAKAADLAKRISAEFAYKMDGMIKKRRASFDQEYFSGQLNADDNKFGLIYVVRSPDPEFQGAYYLAADGTLARNYHLISGYSYLGIAIKNDILSRFKAYEPIKRYTEPELINRLYQMHQELLEKKVRIVTELKFQEIKDNLDGVISIVGINHREKALLITDPVVKCVMKAS